MVNIYEERWGQPADPAVARARWRTAGMAANWVIIALQVYFIFEELLRPLLGRLFYHVLHILGLWAVAILVLPPVISIVALAVVRKYISNERRWTGIVLNGLCLPATPMLAILFFEGHIYDYYTWADVVFLVGGLAWLAAPVYSLYVLYLADLSSTYYEE